MKGVFSLEESLDSLKSLLNSLEDGRILLYFPQSGSSLESLSMVGVLRGNTIEGNTTRNSERKWPSERGSERAFEKPLKPSENL